MANPEMQNLLPGLPDEITLQHIVRKLPGSAFYALSATSRNWRRRVLSRELYLDRARNHSLELLLAVKHHAGKVRLVPRHEVWLYSGRQRKFFVLPPLPRPFPRFSRFSDLMSSGGKLYAVVADARCRCLDCNPVALSQPGACFGSPRIPAYEMDLLKQLGWVACKLLPEAAACDRRRGFKAPDGRVFHFCPYDGLVPQIFRSFTFFASDIPVTNVSYFSFEGKSYRLIIDAINRIEVYDLDTSSWTVQHTIGWQIQSRRDVNLFYLSCTFVITPVEKELFAIVELMIHPVQYCFLQTIGFGSDSLQIKWLEIEHGIPFPRSLDRFECSFGVCPVLL